MLHINTFLSEIDLNNPQIVKPIMDGFRDDLTEMSRAANCFQRRRCVQQEVSRSATFDLEGLKIGHLQSPRYYESDDFLPITVAGPKEYVEGAEAKKFLESFKLSAEEPENEWVKIAPDKEKYEIQFPAKPFENHEKPNDPNIKASTRYLLDREGGNAVLLLNITTFPAEVDVGKPETVRSILDADRDAAAPYLKTSKTLSEKVSLFNKKYPVHDIDFEEPILGIDRTRYVLTPTSLYSIKVRGPKEYVNGPEAKKFIDSFKLKD